MNKTEKIISLLCKQIHLCTDVIITPENFNSLKCNNATANTVANFWTILNVLSRQSARKENFTINLDSYDKVTATKLYLGLLNYSDIEFFALSENNCKNSVSLLITFSWLLTRYNILDLLIEEKVINQIFNYETVSKNHYSAHKEHSRNKQSTRFPSDQIDKLNEIIKKFMQINYNLKDITELINERSRLLIRINHKTSDISHLSWLNSLELTLIKNYYTNNQKYCETDLQYLEKLKNTASIINSYEKWRKNNHIFLKWMTNIVEECKSKTMIDIDNEELLKYISTVRYLNENKIYSFETSEIINNNMLKNILLNSHHNYETKSFTEKWNHNISEELTNIKAELSKKVKRIDSDMQIIIHSVPHCIQI